MLFKKGAEANLYKETWNGKSIVRKVRLPKKYRIPELDLQIRQARTVREAKLLSDARKSGVPTPVVYFIDLKNSSLFLEFIEGTRVKEAFNVGRNDLDNLCYQIGASVGKLHEKGIVHGDLTTSNMILKDNLVYFIDFGLGQYSRNIEDFGVDLHLLHRALISTHYKQEGQFFPRILKAYSGHCTKYEKVLNRIEEIETRGRYVKR
ncbi:MAG: KEOPS complex kinase/ATPase Bud32 [Candidatus Helarchaeota archaeon]